MTVCPSEARETRFPRRLITNNAAKLSLLCATSCAGPAIQVSPKPPQVCRGAAGDSSLQWAVGLLTRAATRRESGILQEGRSLKAQERGLLPRPKLFIHAGHSRLAKTPDISASMKPPWYHAPKASSGHPTGKGIAASARSDASTLLQLAECPAGTRWYFFYRGTFAASGKLFDKSPSGALASALGLDIGASRRIGGNHGVAD